MGERLTTGIPKLDEILGGGLIPGKKVLVYGATGVGKSILGVTIAHKGIEAENHPGIVLDVAKGVDEQSQQLYAREMFGWELDDWDKLPKDLDPAQMPNFAYKKGPLGQYFDSLSFDVKYQQSFPSTIFSDSYAPVNSFLRHHLPRTRRIIIDGSEPYDTASGAKTLVQMRKFFTRVAGFRHVLVFRDFDGQPLDNRRYWDATTKSEEISEYIRTGKGKVAFGHFLLAHGEYDETIADLDLSPYHTEVELIWDRNKLNQKGKFPVNVKKEPINHDGIASVILQTTEERDFFKLANMASQEKSLDAEVNTVIVMGYLPITEQRPRQSRALMVIKHRGSPYDGESVEYKITDSGIQIAA